MKSINLVHPTNPRIHTTDFGGIVSRSGQTHTPSHSRLGLSDLTQCVAVADVFNCVGGLVRLVLVHYIYVLSTGSVCNPMAVRGVYDNVILVTIRMRGVWNTSPKDSS